MTNKLWVSCQDCHKPLGSVVSAAQGRRVMRLHSKATGHVTMMQGEGGTDGTECLYFLPAKPDEKKPT